MILLFSIVCHLMLVYTTAHNSTFVGVVFILTLTRVFLPGHFYLGISTFSCSLPHLAVYSESSAQVAENKECLCGNKSTQIIDKEPVLLW
ncbi:hypothetical protein BDF14DRAFT_1802981 [Spinellus fusiger]|nr:hypothetical protein BDF14DRAFT_1802981 [Spinellus fusiger]